VAGNPPVSVVDDTLIQPIQGAGQILLPQSAPLPSL
jgi:hypothetical protein